MSTNGNGTTGYAQLVPAEFELDLKRALSEATAVSPPALPEERVDDRAIYDPGSRLLPLEWKEFEAALTTLENLPRLEASGAVSFKERRAVEERLQDKLDAMNAIIARRRDSAK